MHFMNVYEIDEAADRWRDHRVLGPATHTLMNLVNAVNASSDGWAYWQAPVRAADKLMTLIERGHAGSYEQALAELHQAYVPLKAFRTRSKLHFEIVEPKGQPLPTSAWGMTRTRHRGRRRASWTGRAR